MAKISGRYEWTTAEALLERIKGDQSITRRHHLISQYLFQRTKQVETVIANFDKDDIDLEMVVEQLWEDLQLARKQIQDTMERNDFYAMHFLLGDVWKGAKNGE